MLLYEKGFTIDGARAKLNTNSEEAQKSNSLSDEFVRDIINKLCDVVAELECES